MRYNMQILYLALRDITLLRIIDLVNMLLASQASQSMHNDRNNILFRYYIWNIRWIIIIAGEGRKKGSG